jgi:hypothetical protein
LRPLRCDDAAVFLLLHTLKVVILGAGSLAVRKSESKDSYAPTNDPCGTTFCISAIIAASTCFFHPPSHKLRLRM